jgi:hypothetical protein
MLILTTSILLGLTSLVTSNPVQIRQDPSNVTSIFKPETLAGVDLYTAGYGVSGIVAYTSPKGDGVLTFGNRSVAGNPITPDVRPSYRNDADVRPTLLLRPTRNSSLGLYLSCSARRMSPSIMVISGG